MSGLVRLACGVGVAAGLTAASAGCQAPPASRVALRLLPPGVEVSPRQAVFWDEVEVARYTFDSAAAIAEWQPQRADLDCSPTRDGLLIRSSSDDPSLVRPVALDASRVKAMRVRSSGLTADACMQLYWAPPGEPFSEARSLALSRDDGTGTMVPTFTFPVWGHPGWTGAIASLRLDPTSVADRRVELFSVTALDHVVREELLAQAAARSYRVDLQGDARRAVLVPPGLAFVREVDVPRHATLRLALGLEPEVDAAVTFRVVAGSGQAEEVLLDETIAPCGDAGSCAWQDRTVDLGRFVGRKVRLRCETTGARPLDPLRGLPVVADLELRAPAARRPPPNVVLVVLDTLRADRLSGYGYHRPTTPRLDAWAATRAVLFENVIASAPWTLPSHLSMFTGLDAVSHGANNDEPCAESLVTLAELLRDAGYRTQAVTGGGYLAPAYGLMQGFDGVRYPWGPQLAPDQAGDDIVAGMERAVAWLAAADDRPFFLLFHTYEVHSPYRPREPHFSRFHGGPPAGDAPLVETTPKDLDPATGYQSAGWVRARVAGPEPGYRRLPREELPLLQDLYDSEVAFADLQVGRLLDRLRDLGLEDRTVVVVTSDHGEALGEHGLAGHQSLQECELRVPLMIAAPSGLGAGRRVPTQVRLVDLAPTVLDLVGLEPLSGVDGRSLVPVLEGRAGGVPDEAWSYAASSNFGLSLRLANRLKYTFNNAPWPPLRGGEALHDLSADPAESRDLAAADPRTAGLRQRVQQHYQDRSSGLRLAFSNRGQTPMPCLFKGATVTPLQVKTLDRAATGVGWRNQVFLFSVPAGETARFFVEGAVLGELLVGVGGVAGVPPGPTDLRRVVSLDGLLAPWQAVKGTDGVWREDAAASLEEATVVRVWVEGDRARRTQAPAGVGQELREQLRRLGYVQ